MNTHTVKSGLLGMAAIFTAFSSVGALAGGNERSLEVDRRDRHQGRLDRDVGHLARRRAQLRRQHGEQHTRGRGGRPERRRHLQRRPQRSPMPTPTACATSMTSWPSDSLEHRKSAVLHQSLSRPAPPNPAESGRPRFRNGSRAGLCAGLPPSRDASCCSHPQTVVRSGPLEVPWIGYRLGSTIERSHGLKPNYQYEKRQREMEKKKKKAEKEQKKAAATELPPASGAIAQPDKADLPDDAAATED